MILSLLVPALVSAAEAEYQAVSYKATSGVIVGAARRLEAGPRKMLAPMTMNMLPNTEDTADEDTGDEDTGDEDTGDEDTGDEDVSSPYKCRVHGAMRTAWVPVDGKNHTTNGNYTGDNWVLMEEAKFIHDVDLTSNLGMESGQAELWPLFPVDNEIAQDTEFYVQVAPLCLLTFMKRDKPANKPLDQTMDLFWGPSVYPVISEEVFAPSNGRYMFRCHCSDQPPLLEDLEVSMEQLKSAKKNLTNAQDNLQNVTALIGELLVEKANLDTMLSPLKLFKASMPDSDEDQALYLLDAPTNWSEFDTLMNEKVTLENEVELAYTAKSKQDNDMDLYTEPVNELKADYDDKVQTLESRKLKCCTMWSMLPGGSNTGTNDQERYAFKNLLTEEDLKTWEYIACLSVLDMPVSVMNAEGYMENINFTSLLKEESSMEQGTTIDDTTCSDVLPVQQQMLGGRQLSADII